MGICESDNKKDNEKFIDKVNRNNSLIENSEISEFQGESLNKKMLGFSKNEEPQKTKDSKKISNACPKLEKYERSFGKKSETNNINQTGSEYSSKVSEEEIIIKGEINPDCPNKEKDFNNKSFMKLVKNNGGIIINEDGQSNSQIGKNSPRNLHLADFGKDNISEIKSHISFQTNPKSAKSALIFLNGKINIKNYPSELSRNKYKNAIMKKCTLDFHKSFHSDKKSCYSNKTINPKINLSNYLNGVFNTELHNNNYQIRNNHTSKLKSQPFSIGIYKNLRYNNNIYEKDSLISNFNNMTNDSTNDDLMGSFISIPKNDERIPEHDLNLGENSEEVSNLS